MTSSPPIGSKGASLDLHDLHCVQYPSAVSAVGWPAGWLTRMASATKPFLSAQGCASASQSGVTRSFARASAFSGLGPASGLWGRLSRILIGLRTDLQRYGLAPLGPQSFKLCLNIQLRKEEPPVAVGRRALGASSPGPSIDVSAVVYPFAKARHPANSGLGLLWTQNCSGHPFAEAPPLCAAGMTRGCGAPAARMAGYYLSGVLQWAGGLPHTVVHWALQQYWSSTGASSACVSNQNWRHALPASLPACPEAELPAACRGSVGQPGPACHPPPRIW